MEETKKITAAPKGAVHKIVVKGDVSKGEKSEYTCFLGPISRAIYSVANSKMISLSTGGMDNLAAGEVILENCWMEGDKEIKENESIKMAAEMQAVGLMELREAELVKL